MALHLSVKNKIYEDGNKVGTILNYLQKYGSYDGKTFTGVTSSHELNRDLVIWFCRDLIPFEVVGKDSMTA